MRTITLEISDAAFKRIRSMAIARTMANMGESQDIMHETCVRISKAKDGDTVELKLKTEVSDANDMG